MKFARLAVAAGAKQCQGTSFSVPDPSCASCGASQGRTRTSGAMAASGSLHRMQAFSHGKLQNTQRPALLATRLVAHHAGPS